MDLICNVNITPFAAGSVYSARAVITFPCVCAHTQTQTRAQSSSSILPMPPDEVRMRSPERSKKDDAHIPDRSNFACAVLSSIGVVMRLRLHTRPASLVCTNTHTQTGEKTLSNAIHSCVPVRTFDALRIASLAYPDDDDVVVQTQRCARSSRAFAFLACMQAYTLLCAYGSVHA